METKLENYGHVSEFSVVAAMNKGRVWSRGGVKRKVWEDAQMECNLKERRKTESEVVKKKVLKKEKSEWPSKTC